MYAVGDGADSVIGEHASRYFTVAHSHTVHVAGKPEGEVSHVQFVAMPCVGFGKKFTAFLAENLFSHGAWKVIVSGGNGRMRGEDAHTPDAIQIDLLYAASKALFETAFE